MLTTLLYFQHFSPPGLFVFLFVRPTLDVVIATGITVALLLARILQHALHLRHLIRQASVVIELTPAATGDKTVPATRQLFMILHALREAQSPLRALFTGPGAFSLEVASTRQDGIRFLLRVPAAWQHMVERILAAYAPDLRFAVVVDYLPPTLLAANTQVRTFSQTSNTIYPLLIEASLAQHDPIGYIAGAMTNLKPQELVALQFVLMPLSLSGYRCMQRHYGHIVLQVITHLLLTTFETTADILASRPRRVGDYRPRESQAVDEQLTASIEGKLSQPLFAVYLRSLVVSPDRRTRQQRSAELRQAIASVRTAHQSLHMNGNGLIDILRPYRLAAYRHRLPAFRSRDRSLLSSGELAVLYHFPHTQTARIENVVRSLSKTLPASVALKRYADTHAFAVVLGQNRHHGSITPIGLTEAERYRHVYIIGGTGNGKTTMLEYAIMQDIQHGHGVAIIDPHGDSAKRLIGCIPESRLDDVVYLNPRDLDHPIGINLMELPLGVTGSDLAHERDLTAEAIISVLRKVFDDDTNSNAYRIERVLRNAIHTAFTVEGATIFTVLRLLTDSAYRKAVTHTLTDESLKRFWKEELGKAGDFQRVKISSGPIARIERYERSEAAKRMLGQSTSTINFEDIINNGKILICNLSKGSLGEDTSALFGATVLAKLQLAAWRRDALDETARQPFYLYVDEFQNFASPSFLSLFSEARKYKLFVTIAQQSMSQLSDPNMMDTIMDNVGTVVAFRAKSPETERVLLHQLTPYVAPGEIGNLPSYNFYIKINAVQAGEPLSGETIVPAPGSERMAARVIAASRQNYSLDSSTVPAQIATPSPSATANPRAAQAATEPALPQRDDILSVSIRS